MRLLRVKTERPRNVYDITLCFDRLFEFSLVVPLFHRYHLSFAVFITFHRALPYWTKSRSKPEGPRPGVLSSVFTVLDNGFSHFVNLLFIQFARHVGDPATDVSTHSWKRPQKRPAGRWNCWWYLGLVGDILVCWPWWVFSLFFDFRLPVHSMRTITTTERSNDLFSVFYLETVWRI